MVFSSTVFLTAFVPLFLWLYVLSPKSLKNPVLLLASVCFYAWGAPQFLFVVLGMTTLTFYLVALMARASSPLARRLWLTTAVLVNVGMLVYFKYLNFFIENINDLLTLIGGTTTVHLTRVVLPIGISFYTFETITYVVDVYRGFHRPLDRLWHYHLYILMFPKLVAGPIVRYHEIADQIFNRFSRMTGDDRLVGMHRFCLGLGKKVLIANALGPFVDSVYGDSKSGNGGLDPAFISAQTAWIAAVAYSLQIYFDFSGYSDMAIGLGRFMGFRLPENFNCPYVSASVTEFWRRWHMTLGNWMRNYLYIPLGGNRSSPFRTYMNLWIVFLLSGLWHGASWNFILWGAWHGIFLVLERYCNLHGEVIYARNARIALTYLIVVFGWVLFRIEDVVRAIKFVVAMLGLGSGSQTLQPPPETWLILVLAVGLSFACMNRYGRQLQRWVYEEAIHTTTGRLFMAVSSIILYTLSLSELVAKEFNPFIYFRF